MTALRDDILLPRPAGPPTVDISAADDFVRMFHRARPRAGDVNTRLARMRTEITATGTYRHTPAELAFGARVALRDSGWCPAHVPWRGLLVRDLRTVSDAAVIARECVRHLRLAAPDGRVRPVVTVFAPDAPGAPGPRILNEQLVRYAGYGDHSGRIATGDRRHGELTETARALGWRSPAGRGWFDQLPLLIETARDGRRAIPLPRDAVREVPLEHPDFPWFVELGLRWHAVPAISNMRLEIGGVTYPCAPFNGVYLGCTIGEDELADERCYGFARVVARRLGLDTSSDRTLWLERATLELNRAVLHSFDAAGVTIEQSPERYAPTGRHPSRPAFRSGLG
ncbi:nitric-oxide synthase [Herbihabitans rhizosphaerae]|uniref:Nitric-oxide synthase n=1 Tax=Herbihabitans rhizosphaerae TaxID=1872711 RepID=A0A4Q7KMD4_9PSEU|nr:nitric oxide synthase oxygenase [Herbihabitans rhizosphaerae]RZS37705.1 nitric-oxide synthase [Herbihabitans rhizosphaerae]